MLLCYCNNQTKCCPGIMIPLTRCYELRTTQQTFDKSNLILRNEKSIYTPCH